jgi:C1A family cysteine protease
MAMHNFGFVPSNPDARDYLFRVSRRAILPNLVDMRPNCSPVREQGDTGSCTGFAGTGLREHWQIQSGNGLVPLSPLFLYYEARRYEGTVSQDSGAQPRNTMKALRSMGCAPEVDWPYVEDNFAVAPSMQAVVDALVFRISSYHRLATIHDAQAALASNHPVLVGMWVYESFEGVGVDGLIPIPAPGEKFLGGHAVLLVGYKMDTELPGGGYFILKNSWGPEWGTEGYGMLPFSYYKPKLLAEAWTGIV